MLSEFRKFAMRGNVIDLAVGIVIGSAFNSIVSSFVSDILMPPIGLLLGEVDFSNLFIILKRGDPSGPYLTVQEAQAAGAITLNYGLFINSIVSFIIITFAVFLLVRSINRMRRETEAEEEKQVDSKSCPFCDRTIPLAATRCPECTSHLET